VIRQGVQLIGADQLPSSVPNHASALYARNLATLLEQLLPGDGAEGAGFVLDTEDPIVDGCLLTHGGSCRHRAVVYGDES
jgi:NAD(P) transhydrogenase subunit alpha